MDQPLLKDRMTSATSPMPTPPLGRLLVADRHAAMRPAFEAFLQKSYLDAFGARLQQHYPLIAGLVDIHGHLAAAAGVRFADNEPLFLEQYLDEPVDAALSLAHGELVGRDDIVEIGSLASCAPLSTLELFRELAGWMISRSGRRFAVATVTPRLHSLLGRAGVQLTRIADADPTRVACAERDWGSYYQGGPTVVTGRIGLPAAAADRRSAREVRTSARRAP